MNEPKESQELEPQRSLNLALALLSDGDAIREDSATPLSSLVLYLTAIDELRGDNDRGNATDERVARWARLVASRSVPTAADLDEVRAYCIELATPLLAPRAAERRNRVRKLGRMGAAAVAILLALAATYCAVKAPNLAPQAKVTASSRDVNFGVDPERLIDGDQLALGAHSAPGRNPWFELSWKHVHQLSRIEIYNRTDCCRDRAVPLEISVSLDGKTYRTVHRQELSFMHLSVSLPSPTPAQHLRVTHIGGGLLHLAEIEAYGK